jgi:hypothetical protein
MASEVFKKVSGEVAGAVASIVGIGIIKSIWTQNNAMARELNRLIREPFQTGTRIANKAIGLRYDNEREQDVREKLLMEAFVTLEKARTLLKKPHKVTHDRFTISFLQSQCAYQTRGGKHLAVDYFAECIEILDKVTKSLETDQDRWQKEVEKYERTREFLEKHALTDELKDKIKQIPKSARIAADIVKGFHPIGWFVPSVSSIPGVDENPHLRTCELTKQKISEVSNLKSTLASIKDNIEQYQSDQNQNRRGG